MFINSLLIELWSVFKASGSKGLPRSSLMNLPVNFLWSGSVFYYSESEQMVRKWLMFSSHLNLLYWWFIGWIKGSTVHAAMFTVFLLHSSCWEVAQGPLICIMHFQSFPARKRKKDVGFDMVAKKSGSNESKTACTSFFVLHVQLYQEKALAVKEKWMNVI